MGNVVSVETARWMAPVAWVFNFASNNYAVMLAKPSMLQANDRHVSAFNPYPAFIGGFFGPQQVLELLYMRELFRDKKDVQPALLKYISVFVLGNLAIGGWVFPWTAERMVLANVFVTVNTSANIYWCYTQRIRNPKTYQEKLTNAVSYTFCGVGLMDFLQNTAMAFFEGVAPSPLVQTITPLAFPLLAYVSPPMLGAFYAYDQIGIAAGNYSAYKINGGGWTNGGGGGPNWAGKMAIGGAVTALAVGLKYTQTKKFLD